MLEIISTRRGRLGITVSLQPELTDSLGALVQAVTPGGPAARAGLQSGDVVAALDGQSIPQLTASNHKSSPGVTLVELVARHGAGIPYGSPTSGAGAAIPSGWCWRKWPSWR